MKKYFLLTIALMLACLAQAQPRIDTVMSAYQKGQVFKMASDKNDPWRIVDRVHGFDFLRREHFTKPNKGMNGTTSFYGNASLTRFNNCDTVEFATTTITPQNAHKYIYHVVANDSVELVHWTMPSVFRANKFAPYAYLGKFYCLNQIIKLEMYEIDNYKHKLVSIINSNYKPVAQLTMATVSHNDKNLFAPDMQVYIPYNKQQRYFPKQWNKKPIRVQWSDSLNHIAVSMKNTIQNDLYHVYLKRTVGGHTDTIFITNNWEMSYHTPEPLALINAAYFNKPGSYEIMVRPEIPNGPTSYNKGVAQVIPFEVFTAPKTDIPLRAVVGIIATLMAAVAINLTLYRRRQKRKLAQQQQQKQIATLQLQSVRAQLNPHFIFNALAGIQNLINKNAIEDANKYLTRFARLTRNVLDDSRKDLISIEQEISLLTDYLQMEQTRFGFNFNMEVDKGIDEQTEIPAMLLQPFVENAVKHGVSELKDEGHIAVLVMQSEKDILLRIDDNGKGFNSENTTGTGIKLCKERIKLFNAIYKNTAILLHINTIGHGTSIIIQLQNWL